MLKCLLVASYETPPRSFLKPQLGLIFLKKYVEAKRYPIEVEIIDPQITSPHAARKRIENSWNLIGFYSTYPTLINSIDLMLYAFNWHRERTKHRPILIGGGPGAAFEAILDISPLDIIVVGEAEYFFLRLIHQVNSHGITSPISSETVEFLYGLPGNYRIRYQLPEGRWQIYQHTVSPREYLVGSDELDGLIQPMNWELDLHQPYMEWTREKLGYNYGFPIYATRGCSRPGCRFCSSFQLMGSHTGTRAPRPDGIVKAIEIVASSYLQSRSFILEDDTFIWNRRWIVQVCRQVLLSKESGKLPCDTNFIVKSRVDQLDKDLIHLMVKTGFHQINVGVESGSPNVLRELNKTRDPVSYLRNTMAMARWIRAYGLRVHAYMIFFSAQSTIEDVLLTIELCLELLGAGAEISTYEAILALPGSPYENLWTSNEIPVEMKSMPNPLFCQSQHRILNKHFEHPNLGILPLSVDMPQYILPRIPVVYALWQKSRALYAGNWEKFKVEFEWRTSTSSRIGWVKLYTYLAVLKGMSLVDSQMEWVDRLTDRLNNLMDHMEKGYAYHLESQSCTESISSDSLGECFTKVPLSNLPGSGIT